MPSGADRHRICSRKGIDQCIIQRVFLVRGILGHHIGILCRLLQCTWHYRAFNRPDADILHAQHHQFFFTIGEPRVLRSRLPRCRAAPASADAAVYWFNLECARRRSRARHAVAAIPFVAGISRSMIKIARKGRSDRYGASHTCTCVEIGLITGDWGEKLLATPWLTGNAEGAANAGSSQDAWNQSLPRAS